MALEYEDKTKLIPQNKYLFSITDINLFLYEPNLFFRKVLLKDVEPVQKTEMTLGTCIHHLCSEIQKKDADRNLIEQEVMEYLKTLDPTIIDTAYVKEKYRQMEEVVIATITENNFKFQINETDIIESEQTYITSITPNVYVGGTLDVRYNNLIIDYKTTSNKHIKEDTEMSERYKTQLYGYAWLCHRNNIQIDKVALQYFTIPDLNRVSQVTGKCLQSYPCRDVMQSLYIQQEEMDKFEKLVTLIGETLEYILQNSKSFKFFARDLSLNFRKKRKTKEVL